MSDPITVLQLATHRLGRPASNGQDFEDAQLPIMGGCYRCGATVAAYNSCPTTTGYIACADGCVDNTGYDTVEEANTALFQADDLSANCDTDDENPFDPHNTGCAACGSDSHDSAHCDTPPN